MVGGVSLPPFLFIRTYMAQSRNPSERNKVGKKKKSSWLDAVVDAIGDTAVGVGRTAMSNLDTVADFGGNMVKGAIYDPVRWAMDNPDEVAKTFVNPRRATDWLTDNFLAGKEVEGMLRGQGGVENPVLAAMALFPAFKGTDEYVSKLFFNTPQGKKLAAKEAQEAATRVAEQMRNETVSRMRSLFPEAMETFESGALNPYSANDARLRRMAMRNEEIAQALRGDYINPSTGQVNRPFESPIEDIGGTRAVDPADRGPYGAENYALPRPAQPSFEADALMEALEVDKQTLARGGRELEMLIAGLAKMQKNAKGAMKPIKDIENQLMAMIENATDSAEKADLRRMAKRIREDILVPMQKKAVETRGKYAEPKRRQAGYEETKGK